MGFRRYVVPLIALVTMLVLPQAASALKFTPAAGSPLTASGNSISSTAVGDFNNDGFDDIAFNVPDGANPTQIHVKLSSGDGTFTDATGSPFTVPGTYFSVLRTADLNDDGNTDLLTGASRDWKVLLGTGDGQFSSTPHSTLTLPPAMPKFFGASNPNANTIGDVDGDGDPDLVVGMFETAIGVALNDGDGNFTEQPNTYMVPGQDRAANGWDGMFSPKLGDFNGDGKTDIATYLESISAPSSTPTGVYVAYGDGTGSFTPASQPPLFSGYPFFNSLSSLRLDSGNTDDVAVAGNALQDGTNFFTALGSGTGLTVNPSPLGKLNAGYGLYEQTTADLDGDGWTDIVVGARGDHQVALLRNIGDGSITPSFGPAVNLPQVDGNDFAVNGVYTGDFNGDGAIDIAADSSHSGDPSQARGIDVLLNRPQVTIDPYEIEFGEVETGSSADRTITVTNDGVLAAGLGDVTFSGTGADQFSLGTTSCGGSLAGRTNCEREVIFSPTGDGEAEATMLLDVPGDGLFLVTLSGTGKTPPPPAKPAKLTLKLTAPKKVKRGKTLVVKARVVNTGGETAQGVTLKIKLPKSLAKAVRPIKVSSINPGTQVTRKIKVKVKKKARKGKKLKVTVTASGPGVKKVTARRSARIR